MYSNIKTAEIKNIETSQQASKFNNTLDNFFKRYINVVNAETGDLPITQHEQDWPSACQQGDNFMSEAMLDSIYWLPIKREANNDLGGLEKALEIKIRAEIKLFFSHYWSEQIDTIFQEGNLSLLFVWNATDMDRLIENQIGHALGKLRNKQTLTFFIACTDSDYIISVENDSGRVVLERPGYPMEKVLANDLTQFINELEYGKRCA
jgi:SecY interacting protein Syd